ncbi:aminopeptidase Y [Kluyveromyces marxianus]|uniref:Peptide hydrolase n=1 Tax=Kluyveromyces marxianus (strain DMKU3-1042 / BCC 29191 / NBRC 104275) TaxID=1003335 RepID=W0TB02_KLUMD|nr:aminopeptidase Y [Kluyveromyces marxianus DMKU3-1042]BAO39279.1 aminopeptidase Y [Kluyveromyces marxianus DMKU3-1042]BAP70791.1 aminopeptidase Y [Kluyveromyces marxianus]
MKISAILSSFAAISAVGASVVPIHIQDVFVAEDVADFENELRLFTEESESYISTWPHLPYFLKPGVESEKLQDSITVEKLNETAWDFYRLANTSFKEYGHPTRVIGSKGHKKTIHYILSQLYQHRDYYDISIQDFPALTGKINSFNLSFVDGGNVPTAQPFELTPPVKGFVGKLIQVPNLGCEDVDYKSLVIPKNSIALIERGQCPFGEKSKLAGKHGFKAALIYDNDPTSKDGIRGTLEKPTKHTVATVGVSYKQGKKLIEAIELHLGEYSLFFEVDSFVKSIKTKNIIADTKHGDPENIVALGAHSDSVEAGPGINDDGSGSISLLTVAKELTHYKINNKVRFAWWAAEEEGLLGSTYYADHLTPEENAKVRLFMDYDMMASPNYEYEVYDANNKDHPAGSEELKNLYIDYYKSKNLNYTLVPFDGRSDYVGFINNGIPAGGIATGAEGINHENGKPFDKCYHSLCDDVSNLAFDAFVINTKLIAHSVATYAKSLDGFPKRTFSNSTVPLFPK